MKLWLAAAFALIHVRPADACSCGGNGFDVPALGATDVPPNVQALYWYGAERGVALTLVNDATGEEVALELANGSFEPQDMARYRVVGELAASTAYAYLDRDGAHRSYFVTGATADTTPPPTPQLASFAVRKDVGDGDCAIDIIDVLGAMSLPEAAVLGARFSSPGRGDQSYYLEPAHGFRDLGGGCKVQINFAADTDVTVAIWTEDAAGNRSAEVTATTRVEGCGYQECDEPGDKDDGGCTTGGMPGLAIALLALRRRRS